MEKFSAHAIVSDYIIKNKINRTELARKMNMSLAGINGQTSTENMRVDVIAEIGALLGHNFFADFAAYYPQEFADDTLFKDRDSEIERLKMEVMMLEREKSTLIGIIEKRMS